MIYVITLLSGIVCGAAAAEPVDVCKPPHTTMTVLLNPTDADKKYEMSVCEDMRDRLLVALELRGRQHEATLFCDQRIIM